MNFKITAGFVMLFLVMVSVVFAEETITITTYYPSPYGVYNELRLYPRTAEPSTCNNNNRGALYYNNTAGNLESCSSMGWQGLGARYYLGSSSQSSAITVTGQTWQSIPGTTVNFSLSAATTIKLRAYGSVNGSGGTATYTHCGFRFVVDGAGYGNSSWGDQIIGCGKTGHPGWWCPWQIERDITLAAGSHSVYLQMTGWSGSDCGCYLAAADYSMARLWVEVR